MNKRIITHTFFTLLSLSITTHTNSAKNPLASRTLRTQKICEQLKQDNVSLLQCEYYGPLCEQHSLTVTRRMFEKVLTYGMPFDAVSLPSYSNISTKALDLIPDLSTVRCLPWTKESYHTAHVICNVEEDEGKPFSGLCPRSILKRGVSIAQKYGLMLTISLTLPFTLRNGRKNQTQTLRAMCEQKVLDTLTQMGIPVEIVPGRDGNINAFSITGRPLVCADNLMTIKAVSELIARKHGLTAHFLPLPGMRNDALCPNLRFKLTQKDTHVASDATYHFIAGIHHHLPEARALLIGPRSKKPAFEILDPRENMNSPFEGEFRYINPKANMYITLAFVLRAGLEGIKKKLLRPGSSRKHLSKNQTVKLYKNSTFMKGLLGSGLHAFYVTKLRGRTFV